MNNKLQFQSYHQLLEYSLKVRWKTSFCGQGESCWCRIIEPDDLIGDYFGEDKLTIIDSGMISKIYAEHIVNLHNQSLK